MTARDAGEMLNGFIDVFSTFWSRNRLLLKRIHGIAAIEPEFGKAIEARNQRRQMAAARVIERLCDRAPGQRTERIACLMALTSFEFFDALAESFGDVEAAQKQLPGLIRRALLKD
jgi:peroxiredoxin family protein